MEAPSAVLKGSELQQLLATAYFDKDRKEGLVVLVNLSLETFDPRYPEIGEPEGDFTEPATHLEEKFWFKFYAKKDKSPRDVALYLPAVRRRDADDRYRLHLSEWLGRSSLVRLIQAIERRIDHKEDEETKEEFLRRFKTLCNQVRVYLHVETRRPEDDEVDYAFALYYDNHHRSKFFERLSARHIEPRGCRESVQQLMDPKESGGLLLLLGTSTGDPFCIREKAFGEASFRYNLLLKFDEKAISEMNCGAKRDWNNPGTHPTHCAVCEHLLLLHKIHQQRVNFPQRILRKCPAEWSEAHHGHVKGAVGLGALLAWVADEFDLMRSWSRIVKALDQV